MAHLLNWLVILVRKIAEMTKFLILIFFVGNYVSCKDNDMTILRGSDKVEGVAELVNAKPIGLLLVAKRSHTSEI